MQKKPRIITLEGKKDPAFYRERTKRNELFVGIGREQMARSQEKLANAVVGVAGAGGLGGGLAMMLARLGVGHIKICDPDSFEVSNINRQLGATPETIGHNKSIVVGELIHQTMPDVTVEIFPEGMQKHVAKEFVEGCDLLVDCVDFYLVDQRYDMHKAFRESPTCKSCVAGTVVGWGANVYHFTQDGLTLEDFYGIPADAAQTEEVVDKLVKLQASFLPRFPSKDAIYDYMRDTGNVPILSLAPPLGQYMIVARAALILMGLDKAPYCTELPPMPSYLWMDASTMECGVYEFNGAFVNEDEFETHFKNFEPERLRA
ncbi:ThiF family adenylyltransferase [Rhizobium sp. 1AS11]|uniref:ThiF family adenylyltransferase n=1 Tax=Rhizobium acaciae TaxID=2989736 RepID=UPI0022216C68|nr:ThiF family adenylyltransferase [Rhizobium acaciae]MCW1413412.1 ThiF family adenylyltransferase [Rhizobium acaciae]MCW1745562.1 ThiF family adenylyltransferase [Rhizobium acaciae]